MKKNKIFSLILNSKITFIALIIIILAQFILTGIIFFQNKKNQYILEQTNFQTSAGLSQIKQLNEKINSLQSYVMRIMTTAQENDRKKSCETTTATTTPKTTLPEITKEIKNQITEITAPAVKTTEEFAQKIIAIAAEAAEIIKADINSLLGKFGFKRDLAKESVATKQYVKNLIKNIKNISDEQQNALNNFVAYGTDTTLKLGEGERAGVVNSYKSAFGKLPATSEEWSDAIKIANGRWPSERNTETETAAAAAFKKIYKRSPDRSNPHDDAAVTVISYGLRPTDRNLDSEKAAIKSFKAIYGYAPKSAVAWDIVRAIAYSGAKR
ncbi:MAG: hypothetical protein V1667_03085 [bacterium]